MPNYDFSQLSSFDFEMLMHGLLEKEWGLRLEVFKAGRDQGIDLRYSRPIPPSKTIIQCKHYLTSGVSKLLADLKKNEAPKMAKLTPDRYVLVTSLGLTPPNKDAIIEIFKPYIRSIDDIIGQTQINRLLEKHPDIEQKNFKLWLTSKAVLDRVLHNAEMSQTEFAVEKVIKKLPLYVQNDGYPRAIEILRNDNVVIISGEPGIGKTTLADMLLYSYLSNGYTPVIIRTDLKEGRALYHKGEKQIFYYDDFLGQTFFQEQHKILLRNEDASLVDFVEMIQESASAKLVMTTREHILSNAFLASDRLRRSSLIDHKYVLRIADYNRAAKARILYNHIYFSELPEHYRSELIRDNFYDKILRHPNFNPRLIEWLSTYRRIKKTMPSDYRQFVLGILENPEEIWREAFQKQISDYARSVLLTLFSFGGRATVAALRSAWKKHSDYDARKYNYPLSRDGFEGALKELEGSFVSITKGSVEFLNPSVKDFLSGEVLNNPEQLNDLVVSARRFEQLVTLWRWSRQAKSSSARAIIGATNQQFTAAVKATLAQPYRRVTTHELGSSEQRLDIYPEQRLAALIAMAGSLQSETLLALIPDLVTSVMERWEGLVPDFEEAINILRRMEEDTWGKARLNPELYVSIRARMFAELQYAQSFYDFMHVEEFATGTDVPVTDEENNIISSAFKSYMSSRFSEDLRQISTDGDGLQDMADFMSKMISDYGYDISRQYDSIMEHISDREQEAEIRADDDYDRWKDQRGFERSDEEAISRMFDTLR